MSINRYEKERERTRLAFLNAAIALILEKGYDNVTVAEITERADYGRSTFYEHFADKEDIAWALLQHHYITLDEEIAEATQGMTSPELDWVAWLMTFRDIEMQRHVFLQMDGETSRRLRQRQKELLIAGCEYKYRMGHSTILEHVPPEIRARYVVGAALEILEYWINHPEAGTADEMAATMFQLVYNIDPVELAVTV